MNLLSKGMARKNMTTGIENNLRKEAEKTLEIGTVMKYAFLSMKKGCNNKEGIYADN
jgi:hypothetical protein